MPLGSAAVGEIHAVAAAHFAAAPSCFRIGDACLEMYSADPGLLDEFAFLYGDCRVPEPPAGTARLRCLAHRTPGKSILTLSFEGENLPDPVEVAASLFWPRRGRQCYQEGRASRGWRVLVNSEPGGRFLMAGDGRNAILDMHEAPADLVPELLVAMIQRVQSGVIFFHAASVGMVGKGVLLVGAGFRGKSTTSLALAGRGHAFFGDDLAAVRLEDMQLLPFRQAVGVRKGPMPAAVAKGLHTCPSRDEVKPSGQRRQLVRVAELFGGSPRDALPLHFAFVLEGFADRTAIRAFRPGLDQIDQIKPVAAGMTAAWGASPGQHLMKFLTVVDVLSRLQCFLVDVGPPEETARMIEGVVDQCS